MTNGTSQLLFLFLCIVIACCPPRPQPISSIFVSQHGRKKTFQPGSAPFHQKQLKPNSGRVTRKPSHENQHQFCVFSSRHRTSNHVFYRSNASSVGGRQAGDPSLKHTPTRPGDHVELCVEGGSDRRGRKGTYGSMAQRGGKRFTKIHEVTWFTQLYNTGPFKMTMTSAS